MHMGIFYRDTTTSFPRRVVLNCMNCFGCGLAGTLTSLTKVVAQSGNKFTVVIPNMLTKSRVPRKGSQIKSPSKVIVKQKHNKSHNSLLGRRFVTEQ